MSENCLVGHLRIAPLIDSVDEYGEYGAIYLCEICLRILPATLEFSGEDVVLETIW